MAICGLSLHHRNTESRKNLEQEIHLSTWYTPSSIHQWMPLMPLIYSQIHVTRFPPMAKLLYARIKANNTHNSSVHSDEGLTLETSVFQIVYGGNSTFIKPNFPVRLSVGLVHPTVVLHTRQSEHRNQLSHNL